MTDQLRLKFSLLNLLCLLTAAGAITYSIALHNEQKSLIEQMQSERLELQGLIQRQAVDSVRLRNDLAELKKLGLDNPAEMDRRIGEMEFIRKHQERRAASNDAAKRSGG